MEEKIDEGCGCGGNSTENIRNYNNYNSNSKYSQDPLVGKRVNLVDGRSGMVDDSIRNNNGEVIGYVIEGDKGKYRVFKNKIAESIDLDEQDGGMGGDGGAFASLDSTPGMGDIHPPIGDQEGSGDVFPSIGFTKGMSKKRKKKKKTSGNMFDTSLMDFDSFIKNSKRNQ